MKMRLLLKNNPIMVSLASSLFFKGLIVFIVVIWERVKPKPPKEGFQRLILVIFGIPDSLETVLKIMTKTDCFGDCNWVWLWRIQRVPERIFFVLFWFSDLLIFTRK